MTRAIELDPGAVGDPVAVYLAWLAEAQALEPRDPDAASLATVTPAGRPRCRMVLIKGADATGFRFFTNYDSDKGRELDATPWAALCVHWKSLARQVRIEGPVERLDAAASDAYWATRPRGSQLGGWASDQSRPIHDRAALERCLAAVTARFAQGEVPRPPHWGGYRVLARRIELWQGRESRLHDRWCFERADEQDAWRCTRLQP